MWIWVIYVSALQIQAVKTMQCVVAASAAHRQIIESCVKIEFSDEVPAVCSAAVSDHQQQHDTISPRLLIPGLQLSSPQFITLTANYLQITSCL